MCGRSCGSSDGVASDRRGGVWGGGGKPSGVGGGGDGGGDIVELLLSALSRRDQSPQVIEFLEHLMRHLPGKLLIIWDGLPSHRSHLVLDFVRQQRGRLWLEILAAHGVWRNPMAAANVTF